VVLALLVGWLVAGLLLALLVGGAVRLADQRGPRRVDEPGLPDRSDLPSAA
jgi:hypothetical protein